MQALVGTTLVELERNGALLWCMLQGPRKRLTRGRCQRRDLSPTIRGDQVRSE